MDRILVIEEPEASETIERVFAAEGIEIRKGNRMSGMSSLGGHRAVLDAGTNPVEVDYVLIAAGRAPNTADLGLEEAGVELTERGHIEVDAKMRTTADGIWAVGDVNGLLPFTHSANEQGILVGRMASGVRA